MERALYTFAIGDECHNVGATWDNGPEGAAEKLELARELAWPSPRFEPGEFAAAFVAANKQTCGHIRLLPSGVDWRKIAPSDIRYRYDVRQAPNGQILVYAYAVQANTIWERGVVTGIAWSEARIWYGRVKDFMAKLDKVDTAPTFQPAVLHQAKQAEARH